MCAPNRRLDDPGDSNKAIAGHQLRTAPTIVRASFGILLLAACTFSADAQKLSLDIPAGTLSKALVALASASGVHMVSTVLPYALPENGLHDDYTDAAAQTESAPRRKRVCQYGKK